MTSRILSLPSGRTDATTNTVKALANSPQYLGKVSEQDIHNITRKIETRFDVSIGTGCLLEAEDYIPWLDDVRGGINWYYWNRYKRHLLENDFGSTVVGQMDIITDEILDLLEAPSPNQYPNMYGSRSTFRFFQHFILFVINAYKTNAFFNCPLSYQRSF